MSRTSCNPSMNRYISIIHRKFQIFLNQRLEDVGINSSEFMYLTALNHNGEMSLTELSDYLNMDNAQTTRVINRLAERDLVKKVRNQNDMRGFVVSLSEKGEAALPVIKDALKSWNEIITRDLDNEEIKFLTEKLKDVSENANAMTLKEN